MRTRIRFKDPSLSGWVNLFALFANKQWFPLEVLVWSESEGRFNPTDRQLECQIMSLGPLAKSDQVIAHANVRGDDSFDFVVGFVNIKFDPDGTAELPHLIRLLDRQAVA
jgi:hypothetical protein